MGVFFFFFPWRVHVHGTQLACYSEICRVLKPGQHFALFEWCVTDRYDPDNERHRSIKAEIESSDGLPEIRSTRQCIQALKGAGFEVIWEKDLAEDSPVPWYSHLDPSGVSWASFRRTRAVRFITRAMLKTLEALRVVPQGSARVSGFLGQAANGLVKGGNEGIFTPMFFVLARKPR